MSPSRHGSHTSVPSGPRRDTDQPSVERGGDRRGDVGRLPLTQRVGARLVVVRARRRAARGRARSARSPRSGTSATYSGCDSGSATIRSRNTWLTNSITWRAVRKLRVRWRGAAPNAERGAQERGDVGAPEAVDRLLGVADDEQAAGIDRRSRSTAGRARRDRPTRAARRGRTGWDRCPGTRRAGGACSGRGAGAERPSRDAGRAAPHATSTSRSWNSSWPLRRRSSASRSVNCAISHASRRTVASVTVSVIGRRRARAPRRPPRARVSTSHVDGQLPFRPALALNFGGPSVSSRSCSYSSGACSKPVAPRRPARPSPSASLSSASAHELAERGHDRRRSARSSSSASGGGSGSGPIRSCTRSQLALHASAIVRRRGEAGVGVEREQQRALERRVVEQEIDEARPAILERHLRPDVVEHLDPGREAGLDRVLAEEPLRERVQGGHRGGVELVERGTRARDASAACPNGEPVATCSSSRRMRSRSSAAAFSVKVTAAISRIGTPARVTSATTRSTRDFVFPDPAPASTNIVSSRSSTIARRVAASSSRTNPSSGWTTVIRSTCERSISARSTSISSSSRRVPRARRRPRARARRACAPIRGSGRGCRARRGRHRCASVACHVSGGSRRHGNTPCSMPSTMTRSTSSNRVCGGVVERDLRPSEVATRADEPVRGDHRRVVVAERGSWPRARTRGAGAWSPPTWDRPRRRRANGRPVL